jgi:hypothetical protein
LNISNNVLNVIIFLLCGFFVPAKKSSVTNKINLCIRQAMENELPLITTYSNDAPTLPMGPSVGGFSGLRTG